MFLTEDFDTDKHGLLPGRIRQSQRVFSRIFSGALWDDQEGHGVNLVHVTSADHVVHTQTTTFGAFVNIAPNRDGLVHISKLGEGRIERVEDAVKVGEGLEVEVSEIDSQGRINLTPVAWLERQVAQGKSIEEARAAALGSGGGRPRRDGDRGRSDKRGGRGDRDRGDRDRGRSGGGRRERAPRPFNQE